MTIRCYFLLKPICLFGFLGVLSNCLIASKMTTYYTGRVLRCQIGTLGLTACFMVTICDLGDACKIIEVEPQYEDVICKHLCENL